MATLTIKPTAAGNDVQIKSGDGNTTHATFGDTSTVNMSAGSIASAVTGTLGSGIVFPAGVALQSKTSELKDSWSWTNTVKWDFGSSTTRGNDTHGGIMDDLTTELTAKGADSDFLVSWSLSQVCLSNHGSYNMAFNIYQSSDSYATPISYSDVTTGPGRVLGGAWYTDVNNYISKDFSGNTMLTGVTLAKGATIKFKIVISSNYTSGGNVIYINRVINQNTTGDHFFCTVSSMTVTEVAT
jgi:hypothetical protein